MGTGFHAHLKCPFPAILNSPPLDWPRLAPTSAFSTLRCARCDQLWLDLPLPVPFILFAAFCQIELPLTSALIPGGVSLLWYLNWLIRASSLDVGSSPTFTFLSQPINFDSAEHPIRPFQSRGSIITEFNPIYRFIEVGNSNQQRHQSCQDLKSATKVSEDSSQTALSLSLQITQSIPGISSSSWDIEISLKIPQILSNPTSPQWLTSNMAQLSSTSSLRAVFIPLLHIAMLASSG
jgi:hypothetical protein